MNYFQLYKTSLKVLTFTVVGFASSLTLSLSLVQQAQAITVRDRWDGDLNEITDVFQDQFSPMLSIAEDYNENNLVPYPSPDGYAVVNLSPETGCPVGQGICWFDKIFTLAGGDRGKMWSFLFDVSNTSPYHWSDYHFEIYDSTFTNLISDVLVGAEDNLVFLDKTVHSETVWYSGGEQWPTPDRETNPNPFVLYFDLDAVRDNHGGSFGIRQIATTSVPEPTGLLGIGLGFGLGVLCHKRQKRKLD
jgi:hypothetical protein